MRASHEPLVTSPKGSSWAQPASLGYGGLLDPKSSFYFLSQEESGQW